MSVQSHFRFEYQQSDLERICADRELETPEINRGNDFYGQASVLKRYAGVDEDHATKVILEHGINLDTLVWSRDVEAPLAMMLSCSPWRAKVQRRESGKLVVPAGFGFLYAQDLVRSECGADPYLNDRYGTLAFPCHSTHTIRTDFDHELFAEKLLRLGEQFQPVVVCGYWKDILDGTLELYQRKGLPVVSCGHMFDRDFMLRFHQLARQFRFATSNKIGTHLFQIVSSGCQFFFTDAGKVRFSIPEEQKQNCGQFEQMFQETEIEARKLFSLDAHQRPSRQKEFVDRFIGTQYKRTPSQLHRLLMTAEWIDSCIPRRFTDARSETAFVTPRMWRDMQAPIRRVLKLKHSIRKRLPLSVMKRAA